MTAVAMLVQTVGAIAAAGAVGWLAGHTVVCVRVALLRWRVRREVTSWAVEVLAAADDVRVYAPDLTVEQVAHAASLVIEQRKPMGLPGDGGDR